MHRTSKKNKKMKNKIQEIEKCIKMHDNNIPMKHSIIGCTSSVKSYIGGIIDVYTKKTLQTTNLLLEICKKNQDTNYQIEVLYNGANEAYKIIIKELHL